MRERRKTPHGRLVHATSPRPGMQTAKHQRQQIAHKLRLFSRLDSFFLLLWSRYGGAGFARGGARRRSAVRAQGSVSRSTERQGARATRALGPPRRAPRPGSRAISRAADESQHFPQSEPAPGFSRARTGRPELRARTSFCFVAWSSAARTCDGRGVLKSHSQTPRSCPGRPRVTERTACLPGRHTCLSPWLS